MKHALSILVLALPVAAFAASPALTSPANGSTLTGSSVTFSWSAGTGISQYQLWVGPSQGNHSYGLCAGGVITSCAVNGLPTNGSTVDVMLTWQPTGQNWQALYYSFKAGGSTPPPPTSKLTSLTCGTVTSGVATCTATISPAAPTGGFVISLAGSASLTVPASVTVAAGATTATFPAAVGSATVSASAGGVTQSVTVNLTGTVTVNYAVSLTWIPPASSTDPVTGYAVMRSNGGSSFSQIASVTAASYTDSTVADGTTYAYQVKSVDAQGNLSAPSNTASISIP